MLRELVAFLCLVSIVPAKPTYNGSPSVYSPATSPITFSPLARPLSLSSLQPFYKIPVEAKILQSHLPVNPQQQAIFASREFPSQFHATSDRQMYLHNPIKPATFNINPAVVQILTPSTVPLDNTIIVQPNQRVINPPTTFVSSQRVPVIEQPVHYPIQAVDPPAIQYVSVPVRQLPIGHFVNELALQQPLQHLQAIAQPSTVPYVSALVNHLTHSEVVNTVPILPVANKVTTEAHGAVTTHPPTTYVTTSPQPVQSVTIQPAPQWSQKPIQVLSPSEFVTTTVAPLTAEKTESVSDRPVVTLVTAQVTSIVPPTIKVTLEKTSSTNPPSAAASTTTQAPIPVFFSAEEVQNPNNIVENKKPPTAPINNQQVPVSQPVPLPVLVPKYDAHLRYDHEGATPIVYTKSFVDRDGVYGDLRAYLNPGYDDYSRAFTYSPASAVSRVSFNGFGVSYGW